MGSIPIACAFLLVLTALGHTASAATHRDEEVTVKNGTVNLACTLTIPLGNGPFPAAVLLSGGGPQDRDGGLPEFRPFKVLAEHFAKHNIATLRCDDRGVGGSSGSVFDATIPDFADDALAAVRVLQARSDIQRARIGLIGHSEGAVVGSVAASKTSDVAYLVWMAGGAVPGEEIMHAQIGTLTRASGVPEDIVAEILQRQAALLRAIKDEASVETVLPLARALAVAQLAAMPEAQRKSLSEVALSEAALNQSLAVLRSPWMRSFIRFDPSTALRRVTCPVLAVFGGRDLQVPVAANRPPFEAALAEAKNQSVVVRVYPEANHLFMSAVTGQPSEYATLPKTFVPSLLDDIAAWIGRR